MSTESGATLILVILAVGYAVTNYSYRFKYKYARETGYRLYFFSAVMGIGFYILSKILILLFQLLDYYYEWNLINTFSKLMPPQFNTFTKLQCEYTVI